MVKNTLTSIVTAAVVSVIVVVLALAGFNKPQAVTTDPQGDPTLAGIETVRTTFGSGIRVSSPSTKGTILSPILAGTVNCSGALGGTATITASTTGIVDCNVTGVKSGDLVFVSRPAGMLSTWFTMGAHASTTANNYFSLRLYNNTGVAAKPPATATSSIPYLILRTVAY